MQESLSAAYLYKGAEWFSPTVSILDCKGWEKIYGWQGKLFSVARAVYALGILLIGPAGALYHLVMAGKLGVGSLLTGNSTHYAHIHLVSSRFDLEAFAKTLNFALAFAFHVMLVVSPTFLFSLPAQALLPLFALAALTWTILCTGWPQESLERFFLPFGFAKNPEYFHEFLNPQHQLFYEGSACMRDCLKAEIASRRLLPDLVTSQIGRDLLTHRSTLHLKTKTPVISFLPILAWLDQETNRVQGVKINTVKNVLSTKDLITTAWKSAKGSGATQLESFVTQVGPLLQETPSATSQPPQHRQKRTYHNRTSEA